MTTYNDGARRSARTLSTPSPQPLPHGPKHCGMQTRNRQAHHLPRPHSGRHRAWRTRSLWGALTARCACAGGGGGCARTKVPGARVLKQKSADAHSVSRARIWHLQLARPHDTALPRTDGKGIGQGSHRARRGTRCPRPAAPPRRRRNAGAVPPRSSRARRANGARPTPAPMGNAMPTSEQCAPVASGSGRGAPRPREIPSSRRAATALRARAPFPAPRRPLDMRARLGNAENGRPTFVGGGWVVQNKRAAGTKKIPGTISFSPPGGVQYGGTICSDCGPSPQSETIL